MSLHWSLLCTACLLAYCELQVSRRILRGALGASESVMRVDRGRITLGLLVVGSAHLLELLDYVQDHLLFPTPQAEALVCYGALLVPHRLEEVLDPLPER